MSPPPASTAPAIAEIMEVFELTSVLGIHTLTIAVPILLEELAAAGGGEESAERAVHGARGGAQGATSSPSAGTGRSCGTGSCASTRTSSRRISSSPAVPWKNGRSSRRSRSSSTSRSTSPRRTSSSRASRIHIRNALGYGATAAEIMEVFELTSLLGLDTRDRRCPGPLAEAAAADGLRRVARAPGARRSAPARSSHDELDPLEPQFLAEGALGWPERCELAHRRATAASGRSRSPVRRRPRLRADRACASPPRSSTRARSCSARSRATCSAAAPSRRSITATTSRSSATSIRSISGEKHSALRVHRARDGLRCRGDPDDRRARRRRLRRQRIKKFIGWVDCADFVILFAVDRPGGRRARRELLPRRHRHARVRDRRASCRRWATSGRPFELSFADCRVPSANLLGGLQRRLRRGQRPAHPRPAEDRRAAARPGPALASTSPSSTPRSATPGASRSRRAKGSPFMLADSEVELQAARLLVHRAAWMADEGQPIRHEALHREALRHRDGPAGDRPLPADPGRPRLPARVADPELLPPGAAVADRARHLGDPPLDDRAQHGRRSDRATDQPAWSTSSATAPCRCCWPSRPSAAATRRPWSSRTPAAPCAELHLRRARGERRPVSPAGWPSSGCGRATRWSCTSPTAPRSSSRSSRWPGSAPSPCPRTPPTARRSCAT